jgi:pimeloyl-ACP methyl ester carboxylesterase
MIRANGVDLCTEAFGDPADPAILLVMGVGGSMLWWEEGFCRLLAEAGRFVIRYDHRDTGRSVTYEPGAPEYTEADLVADAVGVLDAYGIALAFPERVLSLVLISTSPATPGERALPAPTERFERFLATAEVDWSDRDSVVDYVVGYAEVLAGGERRFDEAAARKLVRRDVERANDISASENHAALPEGEVPSTPVSSIDVPTLVIHGTADPLFPLEHGSSSTPRHELRSLEARGGASGFAGRTESTSLLQT